MASFAPYFAGALKKNIYVETASGSYPVDLEASVITLRLDYQISSMQIDGLLKLSLVQKTPHLEFYSMMKLLYKSDLSRIVFESSRDMSSFPLPSSNSMAFPTGTSDSLTTQSAITSHLTEDGVKDAGESEEVVLKAKKRKATGVNLFSNKKVRFSSLFRVVRIICR